ncbi:MAG TPA: tRNA-dihydrouridine synthase [Candidatus Paceibacterota bacterium]|nr:tRNA-dihydrouridine synthase [Candidatus Paceibacterota bacterium]HPT18104.1 tRNA-dihydrouridine synthase [Candidatus Paceibacterota bacterium]
MILGFWKKLKKPFFCLAPMADVTDSAFREIISKCGKPDVFWTEFVSADGLSHEKGQKKLLKNLKFSSREHPIVVQIFGSNIENIKKASRLCAKLGFDGIDINMGCPDRTIEKQNSGSAMIKNKELAKEIIQSAKEGAPKLPVSVKTRIGYNKVDESWIKFLLEQNLSTLTVHLRTRKEMSKVGAHWEYAKDIVELRNEINKETKIIFNGDVINLEDAKKKAKETNCDGVMIGRGIFGNPWLFSKKTNNKLEEKLKILIKHTKLFEKHFGKEKNFSIMKKHFKAYVNGFLGAKELRTALMEAKSAKEVEKIVNKFLKNKF